MILDLSIYLSIYRSPSPQKIHQLLILLKILREYFEGVLLVTGQSSLTLINYIDTITFGIPI